MSESLMSCSIRPAELTDAGAIREIYTPYVEQSTASFELVVPSVPEFAERIAKVLTEHVWLVAEVEGQIVGYAYGGPHRPRAAYRHSVETSAYLAEEIVGRGVGSQLYRRLLDELTQRGYGNAYAGITLPNERSQRFHERFGYRLIGVFPAVGYKFGQWHDVAWYHLPLSK